MRSPGGVPPSPAVSSPPQSPVRERFAFFSLGRKKSVASGSTRSTLTKRPPISLPVSSTSSTGTATGTYGSGSRPSISVESDSKMLPRNLSEPQDPSVKSVSVRCRGTNVTLQVTKQTTVDDFLQSCARAMEKAGRPINPSISVVIEPCVRPGLERRLRRYELVWDVMNAWEPDSYNTLIVSPDSPDPDGELILATVPNTLEEPDGFVLPLYVFQRPGKWSQRYVTLRDNGQMYASKKKDAKPGDKDVTRLCHLSDFDLYLPTEAEMRKQLRPPKRYCYAVRSQERASLFVDNNHYVQFFCTGDPNVARRFRSSVQGWRSWYLVNKKLRLYGAKEVSPPTSHGLATGVRGRPSVDYGPRGRVSIDHGSRGRVSMDHGSRIRPSFDVGGSSLPLLASLEDTGNVSGKSAVPPVPPLPPGLVENNAAVFASNGLLGNSYDERRQQAVRKEAAAAHQRGRAMSINGDGPFVDGPNLLSNRAAAAVPASENRPQTSNSEENIRPSAPEPAGWFPSAVQHSAEQRTARSAPTAPPLSRRPSTSSRAPARASSTRQRSRSHSRPPPPPLPASHPIPHHQHHPSPAQTPHQGSHHHQQQSLQSQHPPQQRRIGPQQPLVDLTPTFVEPPQWSRENRGRGVRAPQGRPLVDLATGPNLPVRIRDSGPPSNLVRRPDTGGGVNVNGSGGTLMEQYEQQQMQMQQQQWGRGRAGTMTSTDGGDGSGSCAGLVRRGTVKSISGVVGAGSSRPGTAAGNVGGHDSRGPPVAYMQQARGRAMGVGDGEREAVRDRLKSVDGRYAAGRSGRREY
ncbi:hypothetical protein VTI74DRAFT_6235 [Chaetomium olivicolor]